MSELESLDKLLKEHNYNLISCFDEAVGIMANYVRNAEKPKEAWVKLMVYFDNLLKAGIELDVYICPSFAIVGADEETGNLYEAFIMTDGHTLARKIVREDGHATIIPKTW